MTPPLPPSRPPRLRRRLRMGAACSVAALVLVGPAASQAGADAPTSQGWWSSLNPGGLLPLPAPSDVPAHGLLVQGGLTSSQGAQDGGAVAFAAVVYAVPSGATSVILTLQPAATSATTPTTTLELCPLASAAFAGEQGGPMADAPAYSCSSDATAKPSSVSGGYRFDATKLVSDGDLAVAILPTSPADRVVLDQPGDSSLTVQQAPGGEPGATPLEPDQGAAGPNGSDGGPAGGPGGPAGWAAGADAASPVGGGGDGAGGPSGPALYPAGPGGSPALAAAPSAVSASGGGPAPAVGGGPAPSAAGSAGEALNASYSGRPLGGAGAATWVWALAAAALAVAGAGWIGAGRSAVRAVHEEDLPLD